MTLDSKKDLRFALWTVELLRNAQLTKKIADRCQSLKVSFYESGQANDFEMTLENKDGFFSDPDIFRLGDEVRFFVWFADRPKQAMGRYSIDEIMNEAPPSIVRVNGLSTDTISKEIRTLRTEGYEEMSLHDIVFDIAERHDLDAEVEGRDIRLGRKEQKEEHDLRYLNRLAEQYGYTCRITDGVLYFIERDVAEKKPVTYDLTGLLKKRTFRYKTFETYQKATVRYYDPQTKEFRQHEVEDVTVKNRQKLKCTERVGSMEEAEKVAKARLKEANKCKIEGEFECMGVPELRAGINVRVEKEAKMFDGLWHIEEAHHEYNKQSGYTVRMKGYKIADSR